MKVSLYEAGGRLEGGTTLPGMTLTGPLLLSGSVSSPTEAIHKQYVDTAVTNLDAASIVSGTVATARLPGLTGDVTSNLSSNVVTLNPSGVTAGDYTKVTVDAKGRTTVGLSLTEADLPALSWSKVSSNRPTTFAGYGITDGVSLQNGVITGALTLSENPTQANHAATKQYADENSSGAAKLVVGDIIANVTSVTPSGFLRCNGGEVSKTTFSALYAVMGDAFTPGNTQPGSGKPWVQQYQTNAAGVMGAWTNYGNLPAGLYDSQALVTKNRVYLIGGYASGGWVTTIYTAAINADGTLGAWTTSTSLPIGLGSGQLVATKNRVYYIGGFNGSNVAQTACYTAPLNADGTLGTWTNANTPLPVGRAEGYATIIKNHVYLFGGNATTVLRAPINADGTLGTWTDTSNNIPIQFTRGTAVVTKNRVYVLAGNNASIYTATVDANGNLSSWSLAGSLPVSLYGSACVIVQNRVYVCGGHNGSGYTSTIYTAAINADGTFGTWSTYANTMYNAMTANTLFVTSSRIYSAGGFLTSTPLNSVYSAPFTGGLNDYAAYFNGTITSTDSANFKLPDYTSYETVSQYFYIKS